VVLGLGRLFYDVISITYSLLKSIRWQYGRIQTKAVVRAYLSYLLRFFTFLSCVALEIVENSNLVHGG
jgi:hypothetical protein